MVYVGEGENLVERLQDYLSHGPSPSTHIRVKEAIETEISKGAEIELHTLAF